MAQSKNSSSSVTCEEISELIEAFEEQNSCRMSIEMRNGLLGGKQSLELVGHAWNNNTESMAPPLLASASVRCSAIRMANLEGAIIRVLYSLDGEMARTEMEGNENKSA